MSDIYTIKHSDLFLEFTRYITAPPKFSEQIPDGAEIILLDSRDKGYTRFMLKHAPKKDANVVFVDVGELAPIHSRVKNPKIISRETAKNSAPRMAVRRAPVS